MLAVFFDEPTVLSKRKRLTYFGKGKRNEMKMCNHKIAKVITTGNHTPSALISEAYAS